MALGLHNGQEKSLSLSDDNCVELKLWVFRLIGNSFGVCVEGYKACDSEAICLENWRSTPIEKIESSNVVVTGSGSRYKLIGGIDDSTALKLGYPKTLISAFRKGFPKNWKSVLNDYYNKIKTTKSLNASQWCNTTTATSISTENTSTTSSFEQEKIVSKGKENRRSISRKPVKPNISIIEEVATEDEKTPRRRQSLTKSKENLAYQTPKPKFLLSEETSQTPIIHAQLEFVDTPASVKRKANIVKTVFAPLEFEASPNRRSPRISALATSKAPSEDKNNINLTPKKSSPKTSVSLDEQEDIPGNSNTNQETVSRLSERRLATTKAVKFLPSEKKLSKASVKDVVRLPGQRVAAFQKPSPSEKNISKPSLKDRIVSDANVTPVAPPKMNRRSPRISAAKPKTPESKPNEVSNTSNLRIAEKVSPSLSEAQVGVEEATSSSLETAIVPFVSQSNSGPSIVEILDDNNEVQFKVPQMENPKASNHNSQISRMRAESIKLSEWCFSFVPPNDQIPTRDYPPFVLFGKNLSSDYDGEWCTSIIMKVLDKDLFQTYNGKLYSVVGQFNVRAAMKFCYPKEYAEKFQIGFPVTWRSELRNIHNLLSSRVAVYDPVDIDTSIRQPYTQAHHNQSHWQSYPVIKRDVSQFNRTTYSQSSNAANKVRRTSSGRVSHQPLDYWAGQRVRYNNEGNALGVEDISTRTIHTKRNNVTRDIANAYGVQASSSQAEERDSRREPGLRVEFANKKRKRQTLVSYSDSSLSDDDNDPYINTLQEISYDDSPVFHKKNKPKRRCIDSADSDDSIIELESIRRDVIRKEKRRLARRQRMLDEMERRASEATLRKKLQKAKQKRVVQRDDEFFEEQERERQRREDEDSTETEVSDDGGEWQRTPRVKVKQERKSGKGKAREIVPETDSDSCDEADKTSKKIGWKKADIDRLKLALAASVIRRDSDWEKVARSLGGVWSPEECKETAIKRLKWSPSENTETEVPDYIEVTARQGTIAYQVQAEERGRKYMMGGGSQEDDFFKNHDSLNESYVAPMPDVATFDPNDSLLSAIKTPVVVNPSRKVGKSRQAFLPEAMDDDIATPSLKRRSGRLSLDPTDGAREDQQRYMHHLIKNKNQSCNASKLGTSMFATSVGSRKKAVHDVTKRIEAIEKGAKGRRRKQHDESDISEGDDDEEY